MLVNIGRPLLYDEYETLRGSCDAMVRFYRLMLCKDLQYSFKGYFLEASSATTEAMRLARDVSSRDYLCIQQVDVSTTDFRIFPLLRIDGLRA